MAMTMQDYGKDYIAYNYRRHINYTGSNKLINNLYKQKAEILKSQIGQFRSQMKKIIGIDGFEYTEEFLSLFLYSGADQLAGAIGRTGPDGQRQGGAALSKSSISGVKGPRGGNMKYSQLKKDVLKKAEDFDLVLGEFKQGLDHLFNKIVDELQMDLKLQEQLKAKFLQDALVGGEGKEKSALAKEFLKKIKQKDGLFKADLEVNGQAIGTSTAKILAAIIALDAVMGDLTFGRRSPKTIAEDILAVVKANLNAMAGEIEEISETLGLLNSEEMIANSQGEIAKRIGKLQFAYVFEDPEFRAIREQTNAETYYKTSKPDIVFNVTHDGVQAMVGGNVKTYTPSYFGGEAFTNIGIASATPVLTVLMMSGRFSDSAFLTGMKNAAAAQSSDRDGGYPISEQTLTTNWYQAVNILEYSYVLTALAGSGQKMPGNYIDYSAYLIINRQVYTIEEVLRKIILSLTSKGIDAEGAWGVKVSYSDRNFNTDRSSFTSENVWMIDAKTRSAHMNSVFYQRLQDVKMTMKLRVPSGEINPFSML